MVTAKQRRLSRDTAQMVAAVPQVVAHRVGRMMTAGVVPNGRDQQEFYLMGAEKVAAFHESWMAMSRQTFAAQQRVLASMLDVTHRGITPVRRRAVANARRLNRSAR